MPVKKLSMLLVLVAATLAAAAEERKPIIPPYEIPIFDGKNRNYKETIAPIKKAKAIDGDIIFKTVVNCFPERVKWGLEVDAVAGFRESDNAISTLDTSGLARHYVGIVAKMPLYSATELTAERAREYQRRSEVAENVSALLKGVADRRRAERELGLFSSLEARSQARVNAGIVEAAEQVGYLEKVAMEQSALDLANATIEGARLALAGQCRDEVSEQVNSFIANEIN